MGANATMICFSQLWLVFLIYLAHPLAALETSRTSFHKAGRAPPTLDSRTLQATPTRIAKTDDVFGSK